MIEYTPKHAAQALEIITRLLPHVILHSEYTELVEILGNRHRWREAHELFGRIRCNISIPTDACHGNSLDDAFTRIAENAAKTAYNCSGENAPFDNASFIRLVNAEKRFLSILESSSAKDLE